MVRLTFFTQVVCFTQPFVPCFPVDGLGVRLHYPLIRGPACCAWLGKIREVVSNFASLDCYFCQGPKVASFAASVAVVVVNCYAVDFIFWSLSTPHGMSNHHKGQKSPK